MLSDLEHIQLAEEKVRRFITLAEEILRLHDKAEQRINEGYRNEYFKPTLRNRVIAGLAVKAGRSFERLIVDARNRRGECAHHLKTMVVYRSRFLGHGYSHIRPDLWVATFGDRRSSAKCGRRILRATPQDASGFRRSPSSCGLRPGPQVSTHLRR